MLYLEIVGGGGGGGKGKKKRFKASFQSIYLMTTASVRLGNHSSTASLPSLAIHDYPSS